MKPLPSRLALGQHFWRAMQKRMLVCDPETAHDQTLALLVHLQRLHALPLLTFLFRSPYIHQAVNIGGVVWSNPFGIPAGVDKNAVAIAGWDALGVGCIEAGTVTPEPQVGKSKPRIFRYPDECALVNRCGFNNDGAEAVARRLRDLHARRHVRAAVGVSMGKQTETPIEDAVGDYLWVFRIILPALRPNWDFVQINISSPNTEGLIKIWQQLDEFLGAYMAGAVTIAQEAGRKLPTHYLKL